MVQMWNSNILIYFGSVAVFTIKVLSFVMCIHFAKIMSLFCDGVAKTFIACCYSAILGSGRF